MTETSRMPVVKKKASRKGSKKLLAVLLLLFCTILLILFFRSDLSKVEQIRVQGNHYAGAGQIKKALGIHIGDSFFLKSPGKLAAKVEQEVAVVEKAEVHRRFPGLVLINVTEYPAAAFEIMPSGKEMLALANGSDVTMQMPSNIIVNRPVLSGWTSYEEDKNRLCKVLSEIPAGELSDVSEIIPFPSAAYADKIKIYTRSHFEAVTRISLLAKKITLLNSITAQEKPGIVTMLEADTYVPFSNSPGGGQN